MPLKFINITEAEFLSKKLLFKFMPLERALDTIKNGHFWFANPTIWKDPFEKRFIDSNYDYRGTSKPFPWSGRVYCMCMTQTATSEAYWNTYSKDDIGISFSIIRQKLLEELKEFSARTNFHVYVGKVEYQKTSDIKRPLCKNPFIQPYLSSSGIGTEESKVRLLLLKRRAYTYENEIRFFIVKKNKSDAKGVFFDYGCPNTDVIETITLDPNLKQNVQELLTDVFENTYQFSPRSKFRKRVQKSLLYSADKNNDIKI